MTTGIKPILVLGLGNDILTDDAVGLKVAQAIAERLGHLESVEVIACCEMGLSLLDYIIGRKNLIVVDSVQTGKCSPGEIHQVSEDALPTLPGMSPHFLGVGEILALGRKMGEMMPQRVQIFAIEVADPLTLGTSLSPQVAAAFPGIVTQITDFVSDWVRCPL